MHGREDHVQLPRRGALDRQRQFVREAAPRARDVGEDRGDVQIQRRRHLGQPPSQHVAARLVEELLGALVPLQHAAARIQQEDGFAGVVDDVAVLLFGAAQPQLAQLAQAQAEVGAPADDQNQELEDAVAEDLAQRGAVAPFGVPQAAQRTGGRVLVVQARHREDEERRRRRDQHPQQQAQQHHAAQPLVQTDHAPSPAPAFTARCPHP